MLVKAQDGTIVLNNDKVTEYLVSDKWDGRFKVIAIVEGNQAVVGRYSTKDKCIAALEMLLECQTMNLLFAMGEENPRNLCCGYVADQPLGVFEMPQEDEVYENRAD